MRIAGVTSADSVAGPYDVIARAVIRGSHTCDQFAPETIGAALAGRLEVDHRTGEGSGYPLYLLDPPYHQLRNPRTSLHPPTATGGNMYLQRSHRTGAVAAGR